MTKRSIVLLAGLLALCRPALCQMSVSALRCETLLSSPVIDEPAPRLTWLLTSKQRGERQTAYQVLVSSSPARLAANRGDLWDSGKTASSQSAFVVYGGRPLLSRLQCYWKVRAWSRETNPSAWSKPARWEMGLLAPTDWQARWLQAAPEVTKEGAPCFRKAFRLDPGFIQARAYVCGLGYQELYINGERVGDTVLDPPQTDYPHRAYYAVYDIGARLRPGANAAGVLLGNGWFNQDRVWGGLSYGQPTMIAQIEVTYPDGRRVVVSSGGDWRVAAGPIVSNNIYAGETYDARREQKRWSASDFDDGGWKPAVERTAPTERLTLTTMPPVRRHTPIKPAAVRDLKPGVRIYDFGQNFAGWARIRVRGAAGASFRMRFAETVKANSGELDTASTGVFATGVEQTDTYICAGNSLSKDGETWEPRFCWHGFRYMEITGPPAGAEILSVEGIPVYTDFERNGDFLCSDPLLNKIHRAALWTLLSNAQGVPTDCPARERCGWLGDSHAVADVWGMNFNMSGFWSKYLTDIADSWSGPLPPDIAPGKRGAGSGNPDWGAAVALLPWARYVYSGDSVELARHFPLMQKYVRNAWKINRNGLIVAGYGDWCPPGSVQPIHTPVSFTSTLLLCRSARAAANAARIIQRPAEEAEEMLSVARSTQAALVRDFFHPDQHSFGSQTMNALALQYNLAPPGVEPSIADALAQDVLTRTSGHSDTGIMGTAPLLSQLSNYDHADVALGILEKQDYPGIAYLFDLGATTFWECYGEPELDAKWGARSLNHPMQTGPDTWLFQDLAGIRPDAEQPEFRHFVLRPQPAGNVTWVMAHYDSVYGRIRCNWKRTGAKCAFDIDVPCGTTATVYIPARGSTAITEAGKPVLQASGVHFVRQERHAAVFTVESGSYRFVSELPR